MIKHKKHASNSLSKGSVRIISGAHRGRKLPVLLAEGLRPTTDRVKETVFNWLAPYIAQATCLDCFAGSGSLGFEALSRGADHVTMVELNKQAAQQLQQNTQLLKVNNSCVACCDILSYLKRPPIAFDVIFLDPPFRKNFVSQVAKLLNLGWIAQNGLIYVEMEVNNTNTMREIPDNWQLLKEKVAGQVAYRLFQRC